VLNPGKYQTGNLVKSRMAAINSRRVIPFQLEPSAAVDTRIISCGDNTDHPAKLSATCVDPIDIDPPFDSNRDTEVFRGQTKETRAGDAPRSQHGGIHRGPARAVWNCRGFLKETVQAVRDSLGSRERKNMERARSKLTGASVVFALFATAVMTASAQTADDLAARGATIANADPLSAALRTREPEGPSRRGFDIGIAAAEGDTLPGPGKQRIHDALSPAEQRGFETAVAFSLERNSNADAAAKGAAIAKADPVVAEARTVDTSVFYWLGFDIATGIFGNPALGALGNTATGPVSLRIRDSLSAAGQRGFNASVTFHLSRTYPRASRVDSSSPVTTAGRNSDRAAAALLAKALPRVPDVVGKSVDDAYKALSNAGFSPKYTYLAAPDRSVLYNHVRGTVPAAGTLLPRGSTVELQIPHPASRLGIGALSLSDVERRDGFDLDEGRYEEVFRGADVVLREDKTPIPHAGTNGSATYYTFKGLYVEPSDGAVFARDSHLDVDDLGSAINYSVCEEALRQLRTPFLGLPGGDYGLADLIFCVLTSKGQIAVVQFRTSDNPLYTVSNFKFHHALFPLQGTVPVKALGRAIAPSTPGPAKPICDVAREARARNSPAAPGLEAQCRAAGGPQPPAAPISAQAVDALASKGGAIANANPLSAELRTREPEGPSRRGFDIGMAAAEGDTLPGPGKQRIHDALNPAEQGGFETAVTFSLERNSHADAAARGAAIAKVDPLVAAARTVERDVFYWLGFDIATGIFGDPALGAQGNTAMGPGSASIRDSLNAAGQRGFNASVTLHLGRKYGR